MLALFVGGPADGERRKLPDDLTRWECVQYDGTQLNSYEVHPVLSKVHVYNRFIKLYPLSSLTVFAYEGLTPLQVVSMILEGYAKR